MIPNIVGPLITRYAGVQEVTQTRQVGAIKRTQIGQIGDMPDLSIALAINARYLTQLLGLSPLFSLANDDVSRLQTANAAVGTVQAKLQRMRAYAAEASSINTSYERRTALQDSMEALASDIDRVGMTTQYNGVQIFNQSRTNQVGDPSMASILGNVKGGWLENAEKMIQTYYGLKADGAPLSIQLASFSDGPNGTLAQVSGEIPNYGPGKGTNLTLQIDRSDFVPVNPPNGGFGPIYNDRVIAHEMTHAVMSRSTNYADLVRNEGWFIEGIAEFIHGGDERVASDIAQAGGKAQAIVDALEEGLPSTSAGYSAAYATVRYLHAQIKAAGGEGVKDVLDYLTKNQRATLDEAFRNAIAPLGGSVKTYTNVDAFLADFRISGAEFITTRMNLANADTGAIGGFDADGKAVRSAETVVADVGTRSGENGRITNTYAFNLKGMNFSTATAGPMNASALGITGLNVIDAPADAIGQIDRAIKYVGAERARLSVELTHVDTAYSVIDGIFGNYGIGKFWFAGSMSPANLTSILAKTIQGDANTAIKMQANVPRPMVVHLLSTE